MRAMVLIAVMLLACLMTIDAGWSRRRSSRSSSRSSSSSSSRSTDSSRSKTGGRRDLRYGPWKRSTRSEDLNALCNFITYDADENGEVILGEFRDVYGESEMTFDLFINLDSDGSGAIEDAEFYQRAPTYIDECADIATDDEK